MTSLQDLKNRLLTSYNNIERMILFGSVARNESDHESDCDLLILTTQPLNRFVKTEIINFYPNFLLFYILINFHALAAQQSMKVL